MGATSDLELKRGTYECFILAVSVLSVANLILLFALPLPESREIIRVCDVVLSTILLLDFGFRLIIARSRRDYLIQQYGWLDFLGSLPLPGVRLARFFRVVRLICLLRDSGLRRLRRAGLRVRSRGTPGGARFFSPLLFSGGGP